MNEYYYNYNANIGREDYKTAVKTSQKVEETRGIVNLINSSDKKIAFSQNTTSAIIS